MVTKTLSLLVLLSSLAAAADVQPGHPVRCYVQGYTRLCLGDSVTDHKGRMGKVVELFDTGVLRFLAADASSNRGEILSVKEVGRILKGSIYSGKRTVLEDGRLGTIVDVDSDLWVDVRLDQAPETLIHRSMHGLGVETRCIHYTGFDLCVNAELKDDLGNVGRAEVVFQNGLVLFNGRLTHGLMLRPAQEPCERPLRPMH